MALCVRSLSVTVIKTLTKASWRKRNFIGFTLPGHSPSLGEGRFSEQESGSRGWQDGSAGKALAAQD